MLNASPSPSSVLALATTVHLALASLRNHRSAGPGPVSSLALVSLALAGLPWLFPSLGELVLGAGLHISWFVVCERFGYSAPSPRQTPRSATTPPTPRPEGAVNSAPARQVSGFVQVPVLAVIDETPSVKTIRLARPEGFSFEAGQFVTVRLRVDGKEYARCYSISSSPDVRGYLEFSVRRQGLVSNALHATVRPGATLAVKRPAGAFRFPAGDDRPLVLLAGGIGITPLMSMLRHAVATEPGRPVTLIYSARTVDDFAFRDELSTAARRHPQLRVCFAVSGGSSDPSHYPGRIDESLLTTTTSDLVHSVVYLCGPADMIASVKAVLVTLGVPETQIRHEVFQAAIAASAGLRQATQTLEPPGAVEGAMPTDAAAAHQMRCARAGRTVPVRAGQTLLEAAEDGGVAIDSLCRAGICGTCKVQVHAGRVECESTVLDEEDQREGFVLACVSTAHTDCTVNL